MLKPQPQQQTHRKPVQAPARKNERFKLVAVAIVIALSILAGIAGHAWRQQTQGDPTPTVAEQQARVAAYVQAGTLNLPTVPDLARTDAIASMNLAQQPAEVRESVENNKTKLAWLTLWDDHDEDGDTVEIISQGYSRNVKLTNAPIRIAVPVPANGVINVRGVYDGGGGITVAIQTEQGTVAVPVMAVGQVIGVPVAAR